MKDIKKAKIAIVQDYLHVYGGAEGVVQAIWELFPNSDIYSATYDAEVMRKAGAFQGAKVHYPKWKDGIPNKIAKFMHKLLIANLPLYFYFLDLSDYDIIISSTAHFAKGVRTRKDQLHISYIHTPPRFLYGYPGQIRKRSKWYYKPIFWPIDTLLRFIDKKFAQFPDYLVCNSTEVKNRIKKFYGRDATIIPPFPAVKVTDSDFEKSKSGTNDYFLIVSRLQTYKNIDLAIKVCGTQNIKLKIAGTGDQKDELEKLARKYHSVELLGFVSDEEKHNLFINSKGFLATVTKEDFGMTPLESMMYGKPVVALRDAGYLDTVEEDKTGVFFDELTEESLLNAINRFEKMNWNYDYIRRYALGFSKDRFKKEFFEFVKDRYNTKRTKISGRSKP